MSHTLLSLATDPLDGLRTFVVVFAVLVYGGAALLIGILLANVLRLFRGRPDMGSVGVGAGALALFVHRFFSEDTGVTARFILAFGAVSILVGLVNVIRARSSSAS